MEHRKARKKTEPLSPTLQSTDIMPTVLNERRAQILAYKEGETITIDFFGDITVVILKTIDDDSVTLVHPNGDEDVLLHDDIKVVLGIPNLSPSDKSASPQPLAMSMSMSMAYYLHVSIRMHRTTLRNVLSLWKLEPSHMDIYKAAVF